jgi:RNA polymerase sigma factor (TIGR02999 family)
MNRCMGLAQSQELSTLVAAWAKGDEAVLNRVVEVAYPELRRIARKHLGRRAASHTLDSCAVVNEVYLKLNRAGTLSCEGRSHFLALCSQLMRRLLVDHARKRGTAKRGAGAVEVTLNESVAEAKPQAADVARLDQALNELAQLDPRKAQGVELRFFGGLNSEEIADLLGISPETVKRDWKMAKAWLLSELR